MNDLVIQTDALGAIVETPSFYLYLSGRQNLAYLQCIAITGAQGG